MLAGAIHAVSPVTPPKASSEQSCAAQQGEIATLDGRPMALQYPRECRTISQFLLQRIAQHDQQQLAFANALDPDHDYLRYGELRDKFVGIAAGILNAHRAGLHLDVHPGDVIAVFCPNVATYPAVMMGINLAGLKGSPAHYGYTEYELEHHFRLVKPRAVFTVADLAPIARKAQEMAQVDLPIVIIPHCRNHGPEDVPNGCIALQEIIDAAPQPLPHPDDFAKDVDPHDVAFLCLSSGTTGPSKAVQVSNTNLITNVQQFTYHDPTAQYQPGMRVDAVTPMVRAAGMLNMQFTMYAGATLMIFPTFSVQTWLDAVKRHRIGASLLMPAMITELLHSPEIDDADLSSLGWITTGGAPYDAAVQQLCMQRIQVPIRQVFGMTEGGIITSLESTLDLDADDVATLGSSGIAVPEMQLVLVNPETLQPVPRGESGEVLLRGANVTAHGYLDAPEANAKTLVALPFDVPPPTGCKLSAAAAGRLNGPNTVALTTNRWLRTGDIGRIDERGHLRIVDRIKELIKYRGIHVPPAEIEAVLLQHPWVLDAAVVGRPDEAAGELPLAFIVLAKSRRAGSDGADGSAATVQNGGNGASGHGDAAGEICEDIKKFVERRVATFKYLRGGIQLTDHIPRNSTGKILRRQLREEIQVDALH